jgi:glycosyltransferase involved in cell wall biosynthesis
MAKTRVLDKHGVGSKKATIEFIDGVKELDPDIINLHNIHGYYINIEILFNYLKEANKPVVWTLHDCWSFTGHCAYFDYAGCNKWQKGCYKCPEKKSYPSSLVVDSSKKNYVSKKDIFTGVDNLTIVTPSNWLADLVKESYLKEYSVKVINNGIDLDVFKPTKGNFKDKYNLNNKYIILGVASAWDRRKGLKYFVKLADKVSEDEVIVLVGLTEKQINQIPQNIIGITRTNNVEELVDIYSSADVFVNPTLEDNFPTTNLEALACGTPVITFDTGGSPECIDSETGILVEKGNVDALLLAINKIKSIVIDEKILLRRSKLFDKTNRFNDYIDVYKSLLERKEVRNVE